MEHSVKAFSAFERTHEKIQTQALTHTHMNACTLNILHFHKNPHKVLKIKCRKLEQDKLLIKTVEENLEQ